MRKELKLFRATLLSSGAALAFAVPAFAQDAEAEQGDEIVVTGFRSSLENSVAAKRNNTSIVEAVSAEEIGKLPDISIAESLGRLPGLATQRLNGRSNVLSIRGLGPDFSTALLNGREQVTTSDNRGVEFDQYPAELLSQALVYKTPYAGLIGQGLAGTVDLRTLRPLDKSEPILAVSGRYEFNEDGSLNPDSPGAGYRATGVWADQFADDTFGVAIGLAFQSSPTQQEAFGAWGYAGNGSAADPLLLGGSNGRNTQSSDLDRIGGFATLQFEPSDEFSSVIDVFYTDFSEDQTSRGVEFPLGFGGGFGVSNVVNAQVDGFATDATFNNVRGVIRNDLNIRRAELFSAGWNGKYDADNGWGVELDISYSKATRRDQLIEAYAGTGFGSSGGAADTLTLSQQPGAVPRITGLLDYSATTGPNAIVLTDPLGWGGGGNVVQAGFINAPRTVDDLWHLKAAVDRDVDFGPVSNVQVGIDWGLREKAREIDQTFLTLGGGTLSDPGVIQTLPIPAAAILDEQVVSFLGFGPQVTLDTRFLVNNVYVPVSTSLSSFATPQSWTVNEDVITGWVKFGIDTELGSIPVTGNAGVQIVHTDQSSDGLAVAASTAAPGTFEIVPVSGGDSYTDFLPTLNLVFDLSDTVKVRFGAARTLARARLDQLSASQNLSVNLTALSNTDPLGPGGTAFGRNSGNPALRPYISNQVDLSIEKYFGGSGYISLAAFYKDLNDFVNTGDAFVEDFSAEANIFLTPMQLASLGTTQGLNRTNSNNGNGRIRGVEASLSVPLDIVSETFSGFGFLTSASFTDSRVTTFLSTNPAATTTTTVPGLSKWVVNSTVYFEKAGFEARVSHRYRTSFLGELAAISATRTFRNSRPESIIDAQIGYAFSGSLEGLRVTAQGLNLTDEPFETFQGEDRQLIDSQSFGRTYLIGASFAF
jgi:iron complex outermembrane receptor protein